MRRLTVGSLVVGLIVALALLGLRTLPSDNAEAVYGVADSVPGQVNEVAIDMDTLLIAPNPANGLIPSVETCNTVAVGGSLDIDIVIDEIDPADLLKGFQATLGYVGAGPGAVNVTGVNDAMMIAANAGSAPLGLSDATPDVGDGVFLTGATDLGPIPGSAEQGEGVLSRITLTGVTPGLSNLTLSGGGIVAVSGNMAPLVETGAKVAVLPTTCPVPSDLKILNQVHNAPASSTVSTTETFTVTKDLHNNGPNVSVLANITSTPSAPAGCTLVQTAGPAQVVLPVSVPVQVVETWEKHCTDPSFHQFTITNEISQSDPNEDELNPADNIWVTNIDETITAQSDVKVSSVAITSVIPPAIVSEDGFNDDSSPLTRDNPNATVLQIDIDKTLHNNGPYGPTTVAISDAGTAVIPTGLPGPAGAVPANCDLIKISGPATADLPVSVPVVVQESYELYCGFSPFTNIDDDLDLDIDDDPANGLDEDGDTNIDEDPSFEVAAFQILNQIGPVDPHIIDPNLLNNANGTGGSVPAFPYSNPSSVVTIDEGNLPGAPGTTNVFPGGSPPLDDDCLIAFPCEQEISLTQPGGNPLHGAITFVPNPDGVPGGLGFDIANGLTYLDNVTPLANGTPVGLTTFSIILGFGGQCFPPNGTPIGGALSLTDGALPGPLSAWAGSTVGIEGPDDPTAPALANPLVWPNRLEADLQSNGLILSGGIVWARYVGYEPITGTPINSLVFNLGPSGFAHVAILGDPTTPSGLVTCTPFLSDQDMLGEVTGVGRLRECAEIGSHSFMTQWTRSDNGATSYTFDGATCSGENDVSITKSDDQTIGDDNPGGDRVHVSIPTQRDIDIVLTNGGVPADIDVTVSAKFTGTTSPPECDVQIVSPVLGSQSTIGNESISVATWREMGLAANEVRNLVATYEIHCWSPVNLTDALQVVVNAVSYRQGSNDTLPDPDLDNNQDQNKVTVISNDDYDGDTVPTPDDNCPDVPNPDQTDTDGDGIGDACDDDDDGDGIDDGSDQCPLIPEDPDGVQDGDGCPDTDVGVDVVKDEDYTLKTSETVQKVVQITVTNGNHAADVLVHALAVSTIGTCEADMIPEPGDSYVQFTTDEDGDTVDDTLWSQLEWTVSLNAGEVYNDTRTYSIHCSQRSSHTFELQVDAVPLPPVEEENVENASNVHKNYPTITVTDDADVKKVSLQIIQAPASVGIGVPFDVVVRQTVHNNGPTDLVDAQDEVIIQVPQDCVVNGPSSEIQNILGMPVSVPIVFDTTFNVTCNTPSTHSIAVSDEITLTGPIHVVDPDPNNNALATGVDIEVTAEADIKITAMTLNAPAQADAGVVFPVTVDETIHNNGSYGPVNATLTFALTGVPLDCVAVPTGGQVQAVVLDVSVAQNLQATWDVTCTDPSTHNFSADNTLTLDGPEHVSDPNLANNTAQAQASTDIIDYADLKISSALPDDRPDMAGNQIVVVPSVPVVVNLSEAIHNNGPYGPVDATVSRTVDDVDCDADTVVDVDVDPNASQDAVNLAVSVGQNLNTALTVHWLDVKKPPYSCTINADQSIAVDTLHVVDTDQNNNADSASADVVRDTDGDTVVDNYQGERDNCQDIPNPDQADADGDGLGDVCDPNPARDTGITCDVLLGPAAVNLSDNNGRYGWMVCEVSNNDAHDQRVTISVTLSNAPNGCTQDDVQILPGQTTFVMFGNETKYVVERIRLECHLPALSQVYDLLIEKCVDSEKLSSDDDGDTTSDEDPIDGIDNDGDSLIDEDPPEGNDVDPSNDCDSIGKPVVIEQP